MDRNILDADTVKNPVVHCGTALGGLDSGICKGCSRPSATLIAGHCTECMTPCDLRDGSCPVSFDDDDDQS